MTTCRDGVRHLAAYADGTLDAGTRAAVDEHLQGCRRCQGFARSYLATPRVWRQATSESVPEGLARKLKRLATARRGRRTSGR